ncbi:MAG: ABC transporter ATP-binding protein [Ferrovibrio sp.]|uniref:ABC transporter ATP-binding protein n=1 Tax=Ferrovibrio sp. TaxID=1917215 RepID=UPI0026314CC0|nr:ABC transporter ATP-binding protein [Ferrovibrio sp.]MCW0234983.1 ABC transporter ATP-binding protein [Ferrovibrio sp.]
MATKGAVVLETRSLTMRFGGVVAVDNVDFELREGELRCLIGPNGAGKSTFFKCLTGQLLPTAGDVLIQDRSMLGEPPCRIAAAGIGVKTQTPSLFNGLTAREHIALAVERHHGRDTAAARIDEVIDRFNLGDLGRRLVGELAHGQRQRVEIAMVVAADPWLVLLDEPAAGMTHEEVDRMVALIHEINRNATMIIVEHDMQFIRMIGDQVTVFHQGAILIEDHVEVVLSDARVREVYLGA